jgi:hypothetical protein
MAVGTATGHTHASREITQVCPMGQLALRDSGGETGS